MLEFRGIKLINSVCHKVISLVISGEVTAQTLFYNLLRSDSPIQMDTSIHIEMIATILPAEEKLYSYIHYTMLMTDLLS